MNKKRFRIWETAALAALSLALCVGTWAQGVHSAASARLVRLHVLAHSDEPSEQRLKLEVRDAVLEYLAPRLRGVSDSGEAQRLIAGHMEQIALAAAARSQGRRVSVSLGTEYYPTREYAGFALPAGEYRSLRVVLGEGRGENWWCVVFPPLCEAAVGSADARAVFGGQAALPVYGEEGCELAFRTVEIYNRLRELLEGD